MTRRRYGLESSFREKLAPSRSRALRCQASNALLNWIKSGTPPLFSCPSHLQRFARHHLVHDVVIGRNTAPAQQSQADFDDPWSVLAHFVRNRTDDRAAWLAHFVQHFGDAVLANDDHLLAALQLFHRLQ